MVGTSSVGFKRDRGTNKLRLGTPDSASVGDLSLLRSDFATDLIATACQYDSYRASNSVIDIQNMSLDLFVHSVSGMLSHFQKTYDALWISVAPLDK
jgi:hypothetical protein